MIAPSFLASNRPLDRVQEAPFTLWHLGGFEFVREFTGLVSHSPLMAVGAHKFRVRLAA
jgi:hypothetical protein